MLRSRWPLMAASASTVAIILLLLEPVSAGWKQLPTAALTRTRRLVNLSNTFGSAVRNSATPYDRITGHPVFSVTTAWGSPYMNMEKLDDLDTDTSRESAAAASGGSSSTAPQSISEEQNEVRTVALYFMDPDDALAAHGEMKQMEQMADTDIRITSCSLAKALRQASNTGDGGLPTGQPPNAATGNFEASDGAMLRYKIVPPKRQLFYAARCHGKERVGLFGDTAAADAQTVVLGNSAIEGNNLMRRREKRERKAVTQKQRTAMQAANTHMEGYTGIPVFYCPGMIKRHSVVKKLLTGQGQETPLFFNYEDLQEAWTKLRQRQPRRSSPLPEQAPNVEVFNLWDVLTSMDRDAWAQRKQKHSLWNPHRLLKPLQRRLGKAPANAEDLQDITFVPSSRSVHYKEAITARGNGKARLRPMR